MASETYIIQLNDNPNFCVGVPEIASGAQLQLKLLGSGADTSVQWVFNDDGTICSAGNPNLCIGPQGVVVNQGQAFLSGVVLGRTSQQWNWLGQPPYIANVAQSGLVLDNAGGNASVGNPVYIWAMHSGDNQQWTLLTVAKAMEVVAAAVV
jgi:Ricin-type beta-trefoil lectin domain-like